MINTTNSVTQAAYVSNSYAAQSRQQAPVVTPATDEVKDEVQLSTGAEIMRDSIADLPPLILDPEVHFQKAEQALSKLLDRYGIGAGTPVDIELNNRGEFEVKGDHPMLSQVEKDLNTGEAQDLRNALIGGHTGMIIGRIGAAVEMAKNAADKNPAGTESYYNWVKTIATEAKNSHLAFNYSAQGVDYQLMNNRNEIITADTGLSVPV